MLYEQQRLLQHISSNNRKSTTHAYTENVDKLYNNVYNSVAIFFVQKKDNFQWRRALLSAGKWTNPVIIQALLSYAFISFPFSFPHPFSLAFHIPFRSHQTAYCRSFYFCLAGYLTWEDARLEHSVQFTNIYEELLLCLPEKMLHQSLQLKRYPIQAPLAEHREG